MTATAQFFKKHRKKLLIGAGLCLFLFGNKGFRTLITRTIEIRRLNREMDSLKKEETALNNQIRQFKSSDYAAEKIVRRELGYTKPGEVEYRFTPPTNSCNPADTCSSSPDKQ